jgi:Pilus formation protein N terminal region
VVVKLGPQFAGVFVAAIFVAATWATRAEEAAKTVALRPNFISTFTTDRPFKTILVGNPKIVEATVQDDRTVVLTPQAVGETNIIFLDERNVRITSINVPSTRELGRVGSRFITKGCSPASQPTDAGAITSTRSRRRNRRPQDLLDLRAASGKPCSGAGRPAPNRGLAGGFNSTELVATLRICSSLGEIRPSAGYSTRSSGSVLQLLTAQTNC